MLGFVIISSSQLIRAKLKKICESQNGTLYRVPANPSEVCVSRRRVFCSRNSKQLDALRLELQRTLIEGDAVLAQQVTLAKTLDSNSL